MIRFFTKNFNLELDLINPGMIKTRTAIKKIAGIICSNLIFNYSKSSLPFEKIF